MTTVVQLQSLACDALQYEKLIYPRTGVDYTLRWHYYQALLAGDKFPPIIISLIGGKYLIVDGVHRWEATKLFLKAKEKPQSTPIEVELIICQNLDKAFIEAITRNITHGAQLNSYEKVEIYRRLQKSKSLKEIATLVHWEPSYLKQQVKKRLVQGITCKRTFVDLHTSIEMPTREEQRTYTGISQLKLINQVILLLKQGVLDIHNKEIVKALKELKDWLNRLGLD